MKILKFLIIVLSLVVGSSIGTGFSTGQAFARGLVAVIIVYLLITGFNWVNRLLKKINDDAKK